MRNKAIRSISACARASLLARVPMRKLGDMGQELADNMPAGEKKVTMRIVLGIESSCDETAVALVRESGSAVGRVVASLINFFNPSHIIVGGGVAEAGDVLLASVRQAIYQYSLPLATRTLTIRQSTTGDQGGIIGAAMLALDHAVKDVGPVRADTTAIAASAANTGSRTRARAEARRG